CTATIAPSYVYALNKQKAENRESFPIWDMLAHTLSIPCIGGALLGSAQRSSVRRKYHVKGSRMNDMLAHFFCYPFALTQERKELFEFDALVEIGRQRRQHFQNQQQQPQEQQQMTQVDLKRSNSTMKDSAIGTMKSQALTKRSFDTLPPLPTSATAPATATNTTDREEQENNTYSCASFQDDTISKIINDEYLATLVAPSLSASSSPTSATDVSPPSTLTPAATHSDKIHSPHSPHPQPPTDLVSMWIDDSRRSLTVPRPPHLSPTNALTSKHLDESMSVQDPRRPLTAPRQQRHSVDLKDGARAQQQGSEAISLGGVKDVPPRGLGGMVVPAHLVVGRSSSLKENRGRAGRR
ncbi:hypothetical protein HK102_006950, partial [Quaeritorhiza haematococci]